MGSYDNKIIVIGACGFIGSHLLERLMKEKLDVMVFDDCSSGVYKNIKDFYNESTVENPEIYNISKLHQFPKIPIVFHLGTPSSYTMYENNKQLYPYTIKDFLTVLEYCRQWKSRLIYASTASLYWGNSVPFKETMDIHPKDLYSECSYQMERLCNLYSIYGVKSMGLRLFNVYGDREENKKTNASIITQFILSAGKGEDPVVYGDGNQTRDFIHVNDVVEALMLSMDKLVNGDILNIGSGTSYSFNEIIEFLSTLLDRKLTPQYKAITENNYVYHSMADISNTKKVLKFNPTISIEDGIRRTAEEYFYKGMFKAQEKLEGEKEYE